MLVVVTMVATMVNIVPRLVHVSMSNLCCVCSDVQCITDINSMTAVMMMASMMVTVMSVIMVMAPMVEACAD